MLLTDAALERNAIVGGKFRVIGKLGGGGMGVVYEGEHVDLKQKVAIKVIVAENQNDEMVKRFRREALVMAQLESDHVVRVMDYGALPSGAPYLVMEFLRGMDLHEYLQKYGRFLLAEVAEIGVAVCDALTDAHSKGIVHRDLKPSNLFLADRAGGRRSLKVLDFGLSFFQQRRDESITTEHSVLGTPLYAAPELFSATHDVDSRADIWALGATLYELATGEVPFPAATLPELARRLREGAKDPTTINPKLPPAFGKILLKCLSWDPKDRYQSAKELRRELRNFRTHGQTSVLFGQAFAESVPPLDLIPKANLVVPGDADEEAGNDETLPKESPRSNQQTHAIAVTVPTGSSRTNGLRFLVGGALLASVAGAAALFVLRQQTMTATQLPESLDAAAEPAAIPTLPVLPGGPATLPDAGTAQSSAPTSASAKPTVQPKGPAYTNRSKPPPIPSTPLTSAPNSRN